MANSNEGSVPPVSPDNVLPETQRVMDELRAKGESFEGDKPAEPPKEPEKPLAPEPPKEEKEPEKQVVEEKVEEHPERKPREPKMIPAWQSEKDKKQLERELESKSAQEKQELRDAIGRLEIEISNLKGTKQENKEEVDDWIDKLVEEKGVEADAGFLKSFANELLKRVPKPPDVKLPDNLSQTLETVAKIESEAEKKREDLEYGSSFQSEVLPKLKEEFPQISDDEVKAIQESMRQPYFSERFITLSAGEIYELTKGSYKDLISPERRATVERGTKGASRGGKVLDYSNMSDEDYQNMTPKEREEANKFLLNR